MLVQRYHEIVWSLRDIIAGSEYEGHVFVVGGAVRDAQMGNSEIKDIDLVIDLPNGGIEFAKWLKERELISNIVVYENFGTAMFHLNEFPDVELEAVHTRKECYHDAKTRNPETSYGTLKEDWQRRDFTINAMYYDISKEKVVDIDDRGMDDIYAKRIRTCGDPDIIFNEDPLRILRMVRFACRFDFTIEDETYDCARKHVHRLEIISKERITDEVTKMLTYSSSSCVKSLCMLTDLHIFNYDPWRLHRTLKTHEMCKGIEEMFDARFRYNKYQIRHDYNSHKMTENMPLIVPVLAKIAHYMELTDREIEHYLQGVLKYPNDIVSKVLFLKKVNSLLYSYNYHKKDMAWGVRAAMNECGDTETFLWATIVGSAEVLHCFHDWQLWKNWFDTKSWEGKNFFTYLDENQSEFYTYKIPIDGNDVMEIFGIGPGKDVKTYLLMVQTNALSLGKCFDREECLEFLRMRKKVDDETKEIMKRMNLLDNTDKK